MCCRQRALPADGVVYTVRPGDSLVDVAIRYGVDAQAVIGANQLQDADQIQAGADIFLPGGRPLASAAMTYSGITGTRNRHSDSPPAEMRMK